MIREALDDDLPSILEIMNDAILNTTAIYDYHPKNEDFILQWHDDKELAGMPVLVCEHDEIVMGYGSYGIFRPKEGYRYCVEHSIYVHRDHRGKGVGKELLAALIERAQQDGFHTMIAGIDAANEGSCAFHAQFGFEEVGRMKEVGYKFDRWLDLVFMQLTLG